MGTTNLDMDAAGPVLGIFFGVSTVLTCIFMNRVQGKTYRIQDYLASRKWHLFQSETVITRINGVLIVSCWVFFFLPVITLIFWGSGLIARYEEYDRKVSGGVAVFLVGFALLFLLFGTLKIKWNRYRISRVSSAALILAVMFITAYQITIVFMVHDSSFFGISAIFLTANAVLMILITFMNSGKTGTSIGEIVHTLPQGPELDIKRASNYDDEITENYKNDDYLPTQNEIFEMFTVNAVTKKKRMLGPFEGGITKLFTGLSTRVRIILSLCLYFIALVILGVYAMLDYLVRDDSRLGIITMIAVIASDVIMYLYFHSSILTSPAEISLHIVLFRLCLFVLGGDYWVYGYSLLYLYFGSYLVYNIALIRFPFMDEIIEKEMEELDSSDGTRNKFDLAKTPEFLFAFCTILFVILLAVMEITKPDDVPLKDYTVDTERFSFWVYGVFSILFVFWVFFFVLVFRIFKRKRNGIDGKTYFFVHYKHVDLFWFFLAVLYGLIAIVAICAYWVTDDTRYLIVGLLAPLAAVFLVNSYLKFALNDFRYLQDIGAINRIIDSHNQKIARVQEKIKNFKKEVASKTGTKLKDGVALTPEEIEELSKSKLQYQPKKFHPIKDEEKEAVSIREDSDEEEKLAEAPKPPQKEKFVDEDAEKFDEEDYDDGQIEEGGSDEEEDEKVPDSARKSAQHADSIVPQGTNTLFDRAVTFRRDNPLGQAAAILLRDKFIDYDGDYPASVKATKQFNKLKDWRESSNRVAAFFTGNLRPNDYHVYISFAIAVFLILIMGLIISLDRMSTEGVSWTVAFLYVIIATAVLVRPIQCDSETNTWEATLYIVSCTLHCVWGLIDLAIRFDFEADEDDGGNYFLVWY